MERCAGEVFAVTVKGSPDRVRLRVEEQRTTHGARVVISAVPRRGEVGDVITLQAVAIIRANLDDARIEYRPLERRAQPGRNPLSFEVDGVTIPQAPDGLVGRLLTSVSSMGNIRP